MVEYDESRGRCVMATYRMLGININILEILIVFMLVFAVICSIFRFLIEKNKIKPNRASRIFYEDDENFVKRWEKRKEKGMLKNTINNIIFTAVPSGIVGIVLILNERSLYGYEKSQILIVTLSMGAILGLINSIMLWAMNQDRYSRLKEKEGNNNSKNTDRKP
jgi:uncharacterized ion transporter superfamily protein YfcC